MGDLTRGCGTRTPGSVYMRVHTSAFGVPIWRFLIDPPTPYTGEQFQGVKFAPPEMTEDWPDNSVLLLDMVGHTHYEVADFVEEARVHGVSRKIPKTFPFDQLLGKQVWLGLLHWHAIPVWKYDPPEYSECWRYTHCCFGSDEIEKHYPSCLYHDWVLLDLLVGLEDGMRVLPSVAFDPFSVVESLDRERARDEAHLLKVETWGPGMFMMVKIENLDYIYDAALSDDDNVKNVDDVNKSGLKVTVRSE